MAYYKIVEDEIVQSINTAEGEAKGNTTKEDYEILLGMFRQLPDGKVIHDNGDGTYSYVDNPFPPDPDPEISDDELLDILMGVTE